jgi:hypothetical protein
MPNSDELSLSEGSGEVTAVVDPGNDGVRIGGAVLLALGCAQMGLGTGLVVAASLPTGGGGKGSGAFRDWGLTTLGLGALVAASGVGMLWLGRTDFELQRGASATRSARARGARWWLGEF